MLHKMIKIFVNPVRAVVRFRFQNPASSGILKAGHLVQRDLTSSFKACVVRELNSRTESCATV